MSIQTMLCINILEHARNCIVYYEYDKFPVKTLSVKGNCLIRIGTRYKMYYEHVPSNYTFILPLPRDTVLVMIFQSFIDEALWDKLYHPSPRQLTSLCSMVISDYQIGYPVECQSIVQKYPVEEGLTATILMEDSSNETDED
jgi:hypothetical protein